MQRYANPRKCFSRGSETNVAILVSGSRHVADIFIPILRARSPEQRFYFPRFRDVARARIPRIRRVTFMHAPPAGLGAFYARREMRRRRDSKFAAVSRQNNTMRRVILNVLEINSESAIRFYSFRYIEDSG